MLKAQRVPALGRCGVGRGDWPDQLRQRIHDSRQREYRFADEWSDHDR